MKIFFQHRSLIVVALLIVVVEFVNLIEGVKLNEQEKKDIVAFLRQL